MNINDITMGMTPQEKEIYFKHQGKRHQEEAEKVDAEKARLKAYKNSLIKDILKDRNDFTYDELAKKPVRTLERIWQGRRRNNEQTNELQNKELEETARNIQL